MNLGDYLDPLMQIFFFIFLKWLPPSQSATLLLFIPWWEGVGVSAPINGITELEKVLEVF